MLVPTSPLTGLYGSQRDEPRDESPNRDYVRATSVPAALGPENRLDWFDQRDLFFHALPPLFTMRDRPVQKSRSFVGAH
jgi:hypothetical protein